MIDSGVVKWLREFPRQEPAAGRVGYGLAIAGHVVVALLLMLGAFERDAPASVMTIPVEIVVEKAGEQAAPPPLSSPQPPQAAAPAPDAQASPSGVIPPVADTEKHAKAPLAKRDVNGADQPKKPGRDGGDRSREPAATPLPQTDNGPKPATEFSPESLPSWAMHIEALGPAPPQTTTTNAGDDDLTAIKEEKLECGRKAKRDLPTQAMRHRARVTAFVSEAQGLSLIRSSQVVLDRHINPRYLMSQQVFVETPDGTQRSVVALPTGFTVKEGDLIDFDLGRVDPSDTCNYMPNVAVAKR